MTSHSCTYKLKDYLLYSIVDWLEDEEFIFRLKLFHEGVPWTGNFSRHDAVKFIEDTEESEEVYISAIKEGLTTGCNSLFTWDFEVVSDTSANFTWDKVYVGSSAVLRYGSVVLTRDASLSGDSFADFLLNENKKLKKVIEDLSSDKEKISDELERCKHELHKYVDIKEDLKKCLYGKFVKLLNAKKKRVRFLEQQLSQYVPEDKMVHDSD